MNEYEEQNPGESYENTIDSWEVPDQIDESIWTGKRDCANNNWIIGKQVSFLKLW